jgi:hypothetical protein
VNAAWHPEWSKLAAVIVLAQVAGLLAYEVWALHRPGDSWPTITAMAIAAIKEHWWAGVVIIGTLGWLIVHFAKRWIAL